MHKTTVKCSSYYLLYNYHLDEFMQQIEETYRSEQFVSSKMLTMDVSYWKTFQLQVELIM